MVLLDPLSAGEALRISRMTLEGYVRERKIPIYTPKCQPLLKAYGGAFVTLHKEKKLQGCIGRFDEHAPLAGLIREMTVAAATRDPRFPEVQVADLPLIQIEISVLSSRKQIADWKSIILGKHGVIVRNRGREGVFLPQVASETDWTLEQFLENLCRLKAGLPPHAFKDARTELYTFEVQIIGEKLYTPSYIPFRENSIGVKST